MCHLAFLGMPIVTFRIAAMPANHLQDFDARIGERAPLAEGPSMNRLRWRRSVDRRVGLGCRLQVKAKVTPRAAAA